MITIATAGKGGTGKTTLIAECLTRHLLTTSYQRVLVVDADPHQCLTTLLAERYALKPAPSLWGEVRSVDEIAARLVEQVLTPLPNGNSLLTLGASDGLCQCARSDLVWRAVWMLAEKFDLVVVDSDGGFLGRRFRPIDLLLLTATPRPLDLNVALRILDYARAAGWDVRYTYLAINFLSRDLSLEVTRALSHRLGKDIHLLFSLPERRAEQDSGWAAAVDVLSFYCKEWVRSEQAVSWRENSVAQ